jgi:hypothetical protein
LNKATERLFQAWLKERRKNHDGIASGNFDELLRLAFAAGVNAVRARK